MTEKFIKSRFNLDDKYALITGAAGLLGIEHASALLEIGANVVITDIDKVALANTKLLLQKNFKNEQKIISIVMDVSNSASIHMAGSQLDAQDIQIEVLINNAAIDHKFENGNFSQENSRLENYSLEALNQEIAVGLTGAFLSSQYFGSKMALRKSGVILNIASDLSVFSPDHRLYRKPNLAEERQPVKPVSYSIIKAGLIGLTRYLATYWADNNVRCNALSPGGVFHGQDDEFVRRLSALIPMGRMARKDEYRATVQFLCSSASSYMNGQNIVMDGGRSVW